MIRPWKRIIQLTFTSKLLNKKLVITNDSSGDELDIDIKGSKFISALKDKCLIQIFNLTYKEILEIIVGQFYEVEVKAGYQNLGIQTFFKGSVLDISQTFSDITTTCCNIICASSLVARLGQSRINLSLSSGINMYSALKYVCDKVGINSRISPELANQIATKAISDSQKGASVLSQIIDSNNLLVNTDESIAEGINIWNSLKTNNRVLNLDSKSIVLDSFPVVDKDGLSFECMPIFNFSPGDIIKFDNSLINLGVTSAEQVYEVHQAYMDPDGLYMVYQVEYSFANRTDTFGLRILAKAKSLVNSFIEESSK